MKELLLPVYSFIAANGILVTVHEFGHFAMAKWVGIKVAQFSIGFGRAVVAYRKGIGFAHQKAIERPHRWRPADRR